MKDKKIVEKLIGSEENNPVSEPKKPFKETAKEWFLNHKPSKRRLIQVYCALLYNANVKGYITGDIFTGNTKVACVPGLNCYSCPGAVGACPLGALQNALSASNKRAPYYVLGIILLYALIFGRMVCGFLCPVGLAQDLLYKIKTPKVKKNRISRIFSYLKYVILAVLVIGVPLIYAVDQTVVPGFCKYICPAGTFGGAWLLLLNKNNDYMYSMLGALFTWKSVLLVVIVALCIFIYRAFCRFICPLGAIYGIFNKFSILGIKVNKDKCIDCGKCVSHCNMDIKKVGDHECINCGECIGVCPTKAIAWKGGKLFVNNIDPSIPYPTADMTATDKKTLHADEEKTTPCAEKAEKKESACSDVPTVECKSLTKKSLNLKDKRLWLRLTAIVLLAVLFVGVFVYANFIYSDETTTTYQLQIGTINKQSDFLYFKIGNSDKKIVLEGAGTADNPYILSSIEGIYEIPINVGDEIIHINYTINKDEEFVITNLSDVDNLSLCAYYMFENSSALKYRYSFDNPQMSLTVGSYDFSLNEIGTDKTFTLSDYRGKVVVVNFWGVWCGPCVEELPEFEEVRAEFDNIEMFCIHSFLDKDKAPQFLIDKGWDKWGIHFLQDTGTEKTSDTYYKFGGGKNGTYPRTIIFDANGNITQVFEAKVSGATLYEAIKKAGGNNLQ